MRSRTLGRPVDAHVAALDERRVVLVGERQQTCSGSQAGTVTAMVPPGRSTRASSSSAAWSSGMCSSTSEAMTRSKAPSAKGRRVPSPCTAPASESGPTSPASAMAPKVLRTSFSSASA